MYLTESDNIWRLYLEGAAEDMVTNALKQQQAPEDIIQFFLQKENGKIVFKPEHVAVLYGWIKDAGANINTLKSDYQNYQKFFQSTPLNQFKSYVDWTEKVHGKRDEAAYQFRHKNITEIKLEGQDKENIVENNDEILILRGDDEHKCVRYGKGYSFCISRPGGGNMYGNYRASKASTFYFIFFKQVPKEDPRHIMVLDHTANGWEWTFGDNVTQQIKGGWNELIKHFPVLAKYENKLVNKPYTLEEKEFNKKYAEFEQQRTLEKFNTFTYQEKAHVLKSGTRIPVNLFDSLDKYLRNEWVSVGPDMSQEIFDKLTPVERERFLKVRKQLIAQGDYISKFDIWIIDNDTALKQQLIQRSNEIVQHAVKNFKETFDTYKEKNFDISNYNDTNDPIGGTIIYELPDLSELDGMVDVFTATGVNLTSLKGLPTGVKTVYCSKNQLTSLEGLPASVLHVDCSDNQLNSLEGLPAGVLYVNWENNPGNFTEEDIENAKRGIFTKAVHEHSELNVLLRKYLLIN